MKAMVLGQPGRPLRLQRLAKPKPGPKQVLVKVVACGVCRTDLHVVDGELTSPKLPIVPGHEIVGRVEAVGAGVAQLPHRRPRGHSLARPHLRACTYCRAGHENLCDAPRSRATRSTAAMPNTRSPTPATALRCPRATRTSRPRRCCAPASSATARCAWRARRQHLGIYGFGAAAHIVAQVARHPGPIGLCLHPAGRRARRRRSRVQLGCAWAGGSDEAPPVALDAAIIFAPVGALVPAALAARAQGRHRRAAAAST